MISWAEISAILKTALRWWWITVLAIVLACGSAFIISAGEPRYYQARTTLMIGNSFASTLPDERQIILSSSLARFYSEMARRKPILEAVVTKLQLPMKWEAISDYMLNTTVVPSANLLEIYIIDSNPERAAAIANAIADELIAYSPSAPDKIEAEQAAVERQIEDSNDQITELNRQLAELNEQRERTTSASDLVEINNKLSALEVTLQREQETYRSLVQLKGSSVVNSLGYLDRAIPPPTPMPSRRIVTIIVAGIAGMMLSFVAIYFLDKLDTRWRGPRDIKDRFGLADLGIVPLGPPMIVADGDYLLQRERAMREAHTNILLAGAETRMRGLLISSPQPNADRSAFSLDLAYIFARAGHQVLLVDADLEHPKLTEMLAPAGLTKLGLIAEGGKGDIWSHLRRTVIPNVMLMPGRTNGLDGLPTLVPSLRWPELVRQLLGAADIVILDGPSALSSADAALLAPHIDGTILTVSPSTDLREDLEKSKARLLHNPTSRLLGAVTLKQIGAGHKGIHKQLADLAPLALTAGVPTTPPPEPSAPDPGKAHYVESTVVHEPIVTPPYDADNDDDGDDQAYDEPTVIITEPPRQQEVGQVVTTAEATTNHSNGIHNGSKRRNRRAGARQPTTDTVGE